MSLLKEMSDSVITLCYAPVVHSRPAHLETIPDTQAWLPHPPRPHPRGSEVLMNEVRTESK